MTTLGEGVAGIQAAILTGLAVDSIPVYDMDSAADAPADRGYAVVSWPAGGGPDDSLCDDTSWVLSVRITAVATDVDTTGGVGQSQARQALMWVAGRMRTQMTTGVFAVTGWRVTLTTPSGTAGIIREGRTLNLSDDWLLTIDAA